MALVSSAALAGPRITELEQRWLTAGAPVLEHARQAGLTIDIIVQPNVQLDVSPLSMAFINGRCKLVLTMRGNPMVEQHLEGVAAALHEAVIEAMVAHEVGHCWRHSQGSWRFLPAGFAAPQTTNSLSGGSSRLLRDADYKRREEGFADLVALAWTHSRRPAQYRQVHAWLAGEREDGSSGSAHDTAVWVQLARDYAVFGAGNLFEQAQRPWEAGLLHAYD
ncbi:MAG: hypothetical protein H7332_03110 [Bdellovibrionales bacterium]|nr:hypothetical protein [Ramlibacter sp.]